MYPDISTIHKRLKYDFDELTSKGLEVVGVYLQGSQNYGLSYYLDEDHHSDVDTKAIVLPHFEDVVESRNWVSYTHVLEDNSHCDVKDVRLMFDCFKKMNINFLEIVFTDFYYINPDVPFYRILWNDYIVKNNDKKFGFPKPLIDSFKKHERNFTDWLNNEDFIPFKQEIDIVGYDKARKDLMDFSNKANLDGFIKAMYKLDPPRSFVKEKAKEPIPSYYWEFIGG